MTDKPLSQIDGGLPPHAIEDAPPPPSLFQGGASIDFRECPGCGGYGVRDNGDNCVTCGGIGRGGLNSGPGHCIGSGELMIDRASRQPLSHAEFMARVSPEDVHG